MNRPAGPGFTAYDAEGQTPLDPDEARGLIPGWIANRDDLNAAEEDNIAHGMAWAGGSVRRRPVLSEAFLRELHRHMFGQVWRWAGTFRDTERNIGVAPHAISSELRKLLEDAAAWDAHGSYPLDERAARLHHRLTWIHPFPNGNGRCSRVFADCYLLRNAAEQFDWGASLPAAERRARYLEALRAADAHDYGPLIAFARR